MKVTIIIPNYNGKHFMEPCLQSLSEQTCRDFKVLVVDNASSDGSLEYMSEHYPDIEVISLKKNYGFSKAVNVGIEHSTTPYVILLNNDTTVDTHYVEEMIKAIEKSPHIFSVSSKMIQMYHPELLDDAGDMYSVLGWAFQRGVGRPEKLYKKSCRVFTACAGAAIYRREVFETIGYFDEMHFAYLEDIDVGYRAKLYGYDNVFCPEAVVYHVGSGTSGSKYNSFKVKLAARNNVYLNYKNMRTWQLLLNSPCLLAGTFVKFLFFKKMGFGKDYVSGFLEGIRTLKNCKRVPSFKGRIQREIGIQLELIAGTAVYVYEFSRRQAAKLGAKV